MRISFHVYPKVPTGGEKVIVGEEIHIYTYIHIICMSIKYVRLTKFYGLSVYLCV